jgi:ATP-dependent DNA ligase
MEAQTKVQVDFEKLITEKSEKVRKEFRALLDRTNKENPQQKDVNALADLLSGNRGLELWRDVASAGYLAELTLIENARATAAVKECWKQRLQGLKKDLGYSDAPMLEQLLIQQAALCWLKLNLVESSYSSTMTQSITLTHPPMSVAQRKQKRPHAAARRLPIPAFVEPMRPTLAAKPFTDSGWLFEPKRDGWRTLCFSGTARRTWYHAGATV